MEKDYLEAELRLPYRVAYGPIWKKFFGGLEEEKILGTKCSKCGRVLVPARSFCPICFVDAGKWVEVGQEGEVISWVLVNLEFFGQTTKPPFIAAMIKLDRADVNFTHLIGGIDMSDLETVKKKVKIGQRVKAVWNEKKNGNIFDIKYFMPI